MSFLPLFTFRQHINWTCFLTLRDSKYGEFRRKHIFEKRRISSALYDVRCTEFLNFLNQLNLLNQRLTNKILKSLPRFF